MDTPICDFVREYSGTSPLRLHMPGHKGQSILGVEELDITEICGADVLYKPQGIIRKSEDNAASLFGSARTVYSTEGSSLSIRAMLYMTALYAKARGKKPLIAAGRNAHKVFITASALLDIDVSWIRSGTSNGLISCAITPRELECFLAGSDELPTAVYITSPDYLGNIADIGGIAEVCRAHDILLLVDNAHGAYLRFLPESLHPLDMGAHICCDSAHKTLPVLTGGGYLHISKSAPEDFLEIVDEAMAMFASTSPSYLILQSLDMANRFISEGFSCKLASADEMWSHVKKVLAGNGFSLSGSEPLKLTVCPKSRGYTGVELAEILAGQGLICEFADPDNTVMMLGSQWGPNEAEKLTRVLLSIPARSPIETKAPPLPQPETVMSAHRAVFSASREVSVSACSGRIMASASVSCPPAVPVVVCGERIDEAAVEVMKYYGIKSVRVIK